MRAITYWFWVLAISWAAITPVMSQDKPSTQSPAPTISRQHFADYNSELRLSNGRVDTDAMVKRLKELRLQTIDRDALLLKLGGAKKEAGRAYNLIEIELPAKEQAAKTESFQFRLNRAKLRQVRRREGHYLLRSNLAHESPAKLWQFYIQLTEVEQAFKELKSDLAIRPIWHQKDERIEAHIFVAFLAYCLQVSLKARLKTHAPGLTPRAALDKLAGIQMVDVNLPTTDGRELTLTRYSEPDADPRLLLATLKLQLPKQPPPRIATLPSTSAWPWMTWRLRQPFTKRQRKWD